MGSSVEMFAISHKTIGRFDRYKPETSHTAVVCWPSMHFHIEMVSCTVHLNNNKYDTWHIVGDTYV